MSRHYVKNSEQIKVTVVEKLQEEEPEPIDPPVDPPKEELVHVHDWNNGVVIIEPTCAKEGKSLYTCKRENCESSKIETITKDNDNHSYVKVVTPPTCTVKGYTTYACACGSTYRVMK